MSQQPTQTVGARYRGLLILWGAQLFTVALFVMLTRFVSVPPSEGGNKVLGFAFGALGGLTFVLSFVVKNKLLARAAAQRRPDLVTTGYVLAFALCEAPALLALVNYFTSGKTEWLLFALSALGFLAHLPRRAPLEAASGPADAAGFNSTLR